MAEDTNADAYVRIRDGLASWYYTVEDGLGNADVTLDSANVIRLTPTQIALNGYVIYADNKWLHPEDVVAMVDSKTNSQYLINLPPIPL